MMEFKSTSLDVLFHSRFDARSWKERVIAAWNDLVDILTQVPDDPVIIDKTYAQILRSKEWKVFRAANIKDCCEKCKSKKVLTLHHDSYEGGIFNTKHLRTLCRKCHYIYHKRFHDI